MLDLDLKKQFARLYKPSAKVPSVVQVPRLRFLMLDGAGDIGGPTFETAVKSLYGLAYSTRFAAKKRLDVRYPVMPLEGLYWDPEVPGESTPDLRDRLAWRLMLMLPDEVSAEFVDEVRAKIAAKGDRDLPRLADVRVETFTEGTSVQIMHIGPYAEETPTIKRLLSLCAEKDLDMTGRHHEIYLGNPTRGDQAKLKTVIRYGVSRR